jgi:hypothetical protein
MIGQQPLPGLPHAASHRELDAAHTLIGYATYDPLILQEWPSGVDRYHAAFIGVSAISLPEPTAPVVEGQCALPPPLRAKLLLTIGAGGPRPRRPTASADTVRRRTSGSQQAVACGAYYSAEIVVRTGDLA